MGKFVKNGKIIDATEKAFKVIYKDIGFEVYAAPKEKVDVEDVKEDGPVEDIVSALNKLTKKELKDMAKDEGLTGYSKLKKEDLVDLLKE
jgi:hypothetical protein